MKYIYLLLLILLQYTCLIGQDEIELLSISINKIGSTTIDNQRYPVLNKMKFESTTLDISINYGHPICEKGFEVFYGLDYKYSWYKLDKSMISDINSYSHLPSYYYHLPNHSTIDGLIGIEKKISRNWKFYTALTTKVTADFIGKTLLPKFQLGNLTYVERKSNNQFSYGLGIYLDQFKDKLFISPLLSINYKNTRRGFELFFPSSVKLYHKFTNNTFIEGQLNFNTSLLKYKTFEPEVLHNTYTLNSEISYNYIWKEHLKFIVAINLPLRFIDVNDGIKQYEYALTDNLGFRFGVSFVVPDED